MDDLTAAGRARIDEIVAAAVQSGQAPGVVSAIACGDTVHLSTAGRLAVDGAPVRADSLFRIASITKPMTAAVVCALVEDGLLRFGDTVDALLPELADRQVLRRPDGPLDDTEPARGPVTVRDLLTFTWGFGMQGAMFTAHEPWPIFTATQERELHTFGEPAPGSTPDPDTWIARLGELPLVVQPGVKWLYQTGSQVLGVLVARAAGAPLETVMRERLFAPLGMHDTAFHTEQVDRLASGYRLGADGTFQVTDEPTGQWSRPPAFADGGAGLLSTASDVLAFGRMLLRGGAGVLRPELVAEMVRPQLTVEQRTNDWSGFDLLSGRNWGLGMSVLDDGSYSWDGGLGTAWTNVPDLDLTVVTLTQREWNQDGPPAVCDDVLTAARGAAR
ncbi:serine hydrolase domain-containing protein [uncultured Jatrophihabitans sp.]|uniref:serine hydrolase domain-containing protein n=1 Tax=uncultured Jatrophihabitans sp. TaxID=1610747 RepID=UPI0035CBF225